MRDGGGIQKGEHHSYEGECRPAADARISLVCKLSYPATSRSARGTGKLGVGVWGVETGALRRHQLISPTKKRCTELSVTLQVVRNTKHSKGLLSFCGNHPPLFWSDTGPTNVQPQEFQLCNCFSSLLYIKSKDKGSVMMISTASFPPRGRTARKPPFFAVLPPGPTSTASISIFCDNDSYASYVARIKTKNTIKQ